MDPDHAVESRVGRLSAILWFWIAAASLTGFLHGVELLVSRATGHLVWFSRDFAWMSPIAYALVMAPGVAALAALAVAVRRTWVISFSAAAIVIVGVFGLMLPYSQVSRLTSLIFAIGVGTVALRAISERPGVWIRRARTVAIGSLATVTTIAGGQHLFFRAREAIATRSLGASDASSTNVLIIILDTVRAASLSLYSNAQRTTPRLEEWSRSGTVFDWAFSPAPWTLPSHASMFTGVRAGEQSADWETPLDPSLPTLAERFRDRGYLTAGFVANMHYTAWDSGLPRGFLHYEDYRLSWQQLVRSSSYTQTELYDHILDAQNVGDVVKAFLRPNMAISPKHSFDLKHGDRVSDAFLNWQSAHHDRPFFAFLNYFDGHQPYYAPPAFRKFSGPQPIASYHDAISFLDAEVDRVLVTLRDRGVLDSTLVIVASDHGELFAFKGLNGHAHNLYINTIRVPLFIRLPGRVPEGQRVRTAVSLRDLAATVIDLAAPGAPPLPGTSLAVTWTEAGVASPVISEVTKARNIPADYPTARGNMFTIIDERWQLIQNGDDRLELYDYRADSLQAHDLAATDSASALLAGLRQRLQDLLRQPR
jgi:arylsulfatase A-like enzyme